MKKTESDRSPALIEDWYAVDFHVHTPASKDYKGEKTDDEYISILQKAVHAGINIISIADHNTIEGYSYLNKLREQKELDLRVLKGYKSRLKAVGEIRSALDNYSKLLILPSVELEVRPNIHLLIVFDPTMSIGDLARFLENAGVTSEHQGVDGLAPGMKWDVLDAMHEASKMGGIVIAAHADTNKGIYEDLPHGSYRAQVFASDDLYAVSYNNPKTRDVIGSLLKQKEYKRRTGISLIQSSDFHGGSDIFGPKRAYLKLPTRDFSMIKEALRNPDERVSCPEPPKLMSILGRLVQANNIFIENIETDENKKGLCRAVCALSNTGDGTIAIGINERRNKIGVFISEKDMSGLETHLMSNIDPMPRFTTSIYPFGDRKIVAIRVKRGSAPLYGCAFDKHFYVRVDNVIREGKASELSEIVEGHLEHKTTELLSMSKQRMAEIESRIEAHVDGLEALKFVRKIESNAQLLGDLVAYRVAPILEEELKILVPSMEGDNGVALGNLIAIEDYISPRPEDHYLRFTSPKMKVSKAILDLADLEQFSGEKLILAPGGGCFYDNKKVHICARNDWAPVVFYLRKRYDPYISLKFIIGWLKSAIPLAYAFVRFGTVDFYAKDHILNLPVPIQWKQEVKSGIVAIVDDILKAELDFLKEFEKLDKVKEKRVSQGLAKESKEYQQMLKHMGSAVDKHNESVAPLMKKIEVELFAMYGLSEEDMNLIKKVLKQEKMLDFSSG